RPSLCQKLIAKSVPGSVNFFCFGGNGRGPACVYSPHESADFLGYASRSARFLERPFRCPSDGGVFSFGGNEKKPRQLTGLRISKDTSVLFRENPMPNITEM